MLRAKVGILLLVGLSCGATSVALAADAVEVLIRKGVDKRRQKDDRGALPLFQEAFEISRNPRAAAQLGLCEQALGMWAEAEAHLSEAVVSQTDSWVVTKRKVLEASLKDTRSHMTRLVIVNAPDTALIVLSGVTRGKLADGPFYVLPGTVEVSITSGSKRFEATETSLVAGAERTVAFVDQSKSSATASKPSAADDANLTSAEPVQAQLEVTPEPDVERSSFGPYKWWAFGVGAAALAVATYGLLARNSAANSFNSEQMDGQKVCFASQGTVRGPGGAEPSERCQDLDSTVSSMSTLATVGFVAGASLVTLGAVFWLIDRPRESQTASAFTCAPNLAQVGLACGGLF